MNFEFTEDQEQLRDAVRKWMDKTNTFDKRRAVADAGGFSRDNYAGLAELGLTGLYVPEDHGGMGMGPVEAMVAMEELGRGIALEPLAQTLIAGGVLSGYAPDALKGGWLPGLASGEKIVVLAHVERAARYKLATCSTTATLAGGGWTVSGAKSLVPIADQADAYLVPAIASGKMQLFLVERASSGVKATAYGTQDGGRAGEVSFNQAAAQLVSADGLAALEHAVDIGIAANAAFAVGAMEKTLAITAEYLNTRKAFGVAISSFQALRHKASDMKMALELGRSMSYYATLKLNAPVEERRAALARAKFQLGESMRFVGQTAVQLHGGIGVTDEYIISHYFRVFTQLEMTYGDTLHHLGEVADRMGEHAGVFA
jgi:alkylation response protein AidB-like acyl-CoA dehydrogenase